MTVGLAIGRFLVCIFLCPGCGLVIGFVCFPRAVGFCLVVCVGCARMWVIDCRLSGVFLFRVDSPFPLF